MHLLDPLGNIVGFGNVHSDDPDGICHGTSIGERHVSIEVTTCNFNGYKLLIPNKDATTLGESLRGFFLWDTNLLQLDYHPNL